MKPSILPKLSALALTFSTCALADVHIVDPSGNGEFLDIAAAIAASVDGDLIYVRPGTYSAPISLVDRDLAIVAAAPGTVVQTASWTVQGTTPDDHVVMSGIELRSGFTITSCAGNVHLQQCRVPQSTAPAPYPLSVNFWEFGDCGIGLGVQSVLDSHQVTLVECEFHGAFGRSGGLDGTPGEHGLVVENSTIALYDCVLRGGDGGRTGGGHPPNYNGAGGDGLRVRGLASVVHYERLVASGGVGGSSLAGSVPGCDGIAIRADSGNTVEAFTHPELVLVAPALLRGSLPTQLSITGPPGALVVLVSNTTTAWRPLGNETGILHVGGVLRISPFGVVPASGTLMVPVAGFDMTSADDFVAVHYQLAGFHLGRRYLSEPRRVHLVSSTL